MGKTADYLQKLMICGIMLGVVGGYSISSLPITTNNNETYARTYHRHHRYHHYQRPKVVNHKNNSYRSEGSI